MQNSKFASPLLFILGAFLLFPSASFALEGTSADNIKIKFYAKQGGEWIKASTKRADDKGVLEFKNVLPGWYELEVNDEEDKELGQAFTVKARMVDVEGQKLDEKTKVSLSYENSAGEKTLIGLLETDEDGWLELFPVYPEVKYYFGIDEDDNAHLKSKEGQARVKVKANINGSDWFQARYDRTDNQNTLRLKDVLPGKYKFSYNKKDRAADQPFNLEIQMLDEDGKKIKEETKVKLYVYQNKLKTLVAELTTDEKGWLSLPGTMTKMKYKLSL
jgi:predicted thioesterase